MNITIREQETITLDDIVINTVRDEFVSKSITARINGLPRPILLWRGEEEYEEAGVWTNESVLARATEILSLSSIRWA